jgi:hypothetical protein
MAVIVTVAPDGATALTVNVALTVRFEKVVGVKTGLFAFRTVELTVTDVERDERVLIPITFVAST